MHNKINKRWMRAPVAMAMALVTGVGLGGHGSSAAQSAEVPSYLSIAAASGKLGVACQPGYSCESHRLGGHVRVGALVAPAWRLDLGVARLDRVEVGYSALGSSVQTRTVRKRVFVGTGTSVLRNIEEKIDLSSTALTLDTLTVAPVMDDVQAWLRLGVAMVATTAKSYEAGATMGSVTENHVAPHLGLGVDWTWMPTLVLSAGVDSTRVSASGLSGRATALHLGVKLGF